MILDLFGAHSYANESWFDRSWMREHGDLPERELLNKLRACTWGLAPMALTDSDPRYNRFSFPTKLKELVSRMITAMVSLSSNCEGKPPRANRYVAVFSNITAYNIYQHNGLARERSWCDGWTTV